MMLTLIASLLPESISKQLILDVLRKGVILSTVKVDINGKVFGAEITAKLKVIDCTCSGVITASVLVGTDVRRVYVISVLGSITVHCWRFVLVLQVNESWSPGHTDITTEGVSVTAPACIV